MAPRFALFITAIASVIALALAASPSCDVAGFALSNSATAALAEVAQGSSISIRSTSGVTKRLDLSLCARTDIAAFKTSGVPESCGRALAMVADATAPCGTLFNATVSITENAAAAATMPTSGVSAPVVSVTLAQETGSATRVVVHFACSAPSFQSAMLATSADAADDFSAIYLSTPALCPGYVAGTNAPAAPKETKHPELAVKRGFVVLIIVSGVAFVLIVALVTAWVQRASAAEAASKDSGNVDISPA